MNKSKIEWCDSTWNPVTGCLHNCTYCYARRIANRFGRALYNETLIEIDEPIQVLQEKGGWRYCPYPAQFKPTFHRYRLDEPIRKTRPRKIFVCSMADLFGDWVPDEWIQEVFETCKKAPQHKYLFLTKNPKRLCELANMDKLPADNNFWYGSTVTSKNSLRYPGRLTGNTFLSIEPLLEPLDAGLGSFGNAKWIIIGAETGNRKDKIVPKREWIENIVEAASITRIPIFMKNSLKELMGDNFIQEWPEGLK
jgi:protein gp37